MCSSDLGVAEGRTPLIDFTFTFHFPALEKEMATHSSTLAWRIPGEGGHDNSLQSSCLENPMDRGAWWATVQGVAESRTRLGDFTLTFHFHALEKEMATHPVFLPGESQGWGSLVGCRLWGHTESDTTEATWQQQQQRAGGVRMGSDC